MTASVKDNSGTKSVLISKTRTGMASIDLWPYESATGGVSISSDDLIQAVESEFGGVFITAVTLARWELELIYGPVEEPAEMEAHTARSLAGYYVARMLELEKAEESMSRQTDALSRLIVKSRPMLGSSSRSLAEDILSSGAVTVNLEDEVD